MHFIMMLVDVPDTLPSMLQKATMTWHPLPHTVLTLCRNNTRRLKTTPCHRCWTPTTSRFFLATTTWPHFPRCCLPSASWSSVVQGVYNAARLFNSQSRVFPHYTSLILFDVNNCSARYALLGLAVDIVQDQSIAAAAGATSQRARKCILCCGARSHSHLDDETRSCAEGISSDDGRSSLPKRSAVVSLSNLGKRFEHCTFDRIM